MLLLNLGGIGDTVRLGVLFLLREIGDRVFSFHMVSAPEDACSAQVMRKGDSNPHGLLYWILGLNLLRQTGF